MVDFVNTVAWRGDAARRIDHFADYSDVVAWCRHAGVLSASEAAVLTRAATSDTGSAQRALARAKRLREALHLLWTDGAPSSLDAVTAAYASAMRHRPLRPVDDRVAWVDGPLTVRFPIDRLAVAAVDLLTETATDRVKRCHDVACGWLFLDHSHRQNRRWCSAADCGNRYRARRHYARTRG